MPGGHQHDPRTDAQLVRAINAGDERAFEALYHRHRDWVAGLALRFTQDREAALDVLQETFLYLVRKAPNLRLDGRLTSLLYPVVKHLSIAHNRKRRREPPLDPAAMPPRVAADPLPDPQDPREALAELVADLPEAQREVLLMRYVDGMTLAEAAAALDLPVGTVKSRLHHALARLRGDPRTKKYFTD